MGRWMVGAALVVAAGAQAQAPADAPRGLAGIEACRAERDDGRRLACFDRAAAALSDAARKREVVVLDQSEVRETRRGLFGFSLPRIKLFGGSDRQEEAERVERIESTVASAQPLADGRWLIVLKEGGTWRTTEALRAPPPSGAKVTIRTAAMASFFLSVDGQRSARAMRVR